MSNAPACCMQLGGVMLANQCPLTCNYPIPDGPGWKQGVDSFGCPTWIRPPGEAACTDADAGAAACTNPPLALPGYSPPPLVPPRDPSESCTEEELTRFYDACIGNLSTTAACASFQQSDIACSQCLLSTSDDTQWGPVVITPTTWELNVPGCVALATGDGSSTGCASKMAAVQGCEDLACAGCAAAPGASPDFRVRCTLLADVTVCLEYREAACDLTKVGASVCDVGGETPSSFAALASIFCGP